MTTRARRPPDHIPPAVWTFAAELRERRGSLATDALELATLDRLIHPDAKPIWDDLRKQGVEDAQSWRILLDHFITSTPGVGFDADLMDKLMVARARQSRIAELAEELGYLLGDHEQETSEAAISTPFELSSVKRLLKSAGWRPPHLEPWKKADLDRSFEHFHPAELLHLIARVAGEHEPTPMYPEQAYATKGYRSKKVAKEDEEAFPVRKWIWATDDTFRDYILCQIHPRTLEIGHETKARLARAILADRLPQGLDVTADTVRKARKAAPEPLPSDYVIFF